MIASSQTSFGAYKPELIHQPLDSAEQIAGLDAYSTIMAIRTIESRLEALSVSEENETSNGANAHKKSKVSLIQET